MYDELPMRVVVAALDSLSDAASAQLPGLEGRLEAIASGSAEQAGQEVDRNVLTRDVLDGADRVDDAVFVCPAS